MADALPFGYTHRNKRSRARMEDHDMPQRYHGDGLDYRRPVTSNVIDLTQETNENPRAPPMRAPRPPRFGRDIMRDVIDLVDEDTQRPAPHSPEIQFVSSRPIERREEDEVEFVSENPLPEARRIERGRNMLSVDMVQHILELPHLRAHFENHDRRHQAERTERQRQATMNRFVHRAQVAANRGAPRIPRRAGGHIQVGAFVAPTMHYGHAAFNLGYRDVEEEPPAAPTYNAPQQAPAGFTRSPQEEDTLICPNCEEELCKGETEQKRQVWIVKSCGHVYCGECTANRAVSKSSTKGKEKQPTSRKFKICVVEDCDKKVASPKTMVQIFL
ncbi:hypothetical protein P280DRAFT_464420 [Massarina eburnea CBS 473.64]|uniref:RING-type domain-containing protein n=1 Tax=Massarina eburnea CBS 473.64 TaxID=1395130 RepID=A0A6A6SF64_9PLEO|nr:hypothetical protein P280DRAFT_464420 [Massarina eburnea CBS 473.64]